MKKIIALLLAGAMILSLCACGQKKDLPEQMEETVVESTLSSVQYSDGNVMLRFTCVDDVWKWADGMEFPLDTAFVTEMIEEIKELLQTESIGKMEDAATYGLDNAVKYVTVSDQEKSVQIVFGKQNAEGQWYMSRDDQPGMLYLAENDFVEKLSVGIHDMAVLPAVPQFTEDTIHSAKLEQGEELQLTLFWKDNRWYSAGKPFAANGLEKELAALAIEKCVDYRPTDGAVSLCGLDAPLVLTVHYTNTVETAAEWVFRIGGLSIDGEGYYISVGEDSAIYQMPADCLTRILALADQNRVLPEGSGETEGNP